MHLVLDTNIIYSEGFANSVLFRFLTSSAALLDHKIHVPALVIDEVFSKFEEELARKQEQTNRDLRRLERILGRPLESSTVDFDPHEEACLLRNKLEDYESVLAYPDTPHKKLARRAIDRKRPFDQKGSGYRDSLIWESVVELASQLDEQVVLLASDNIFSDGEGHLAKELKAELVERGLDDTKVILVQCVLDFVDKYVRPMLGEALEGEPTETLIQLGIDPNETIALAIQQEYVGKEWDNEELGLPWEYETLSLTMVEDVSDLERIDARELHPGEYWLRISATLDCEFDCFVYKADVYGLDDLTIYEFDWNDHYVWGGVSRQLRFELDITVDFPGGTEPEISVLSMRPIEP